MNSKTLNIIAWVAQIALAALFVMPGWMKLTTPIDKMIEMHMLEPGGSPVFMRMLGFLELAGSVGIILPWALKKLPVLTPIAALGFAAVMTGALFVHAGMKDYKTFPLLIGALVASSFVAWFRFKQLREQRVITTLTREAEFI